MKRGAGLGDVSVRDLFRSRFFVLLISLVALMLAIPAVERYAPGTWAAELIRLSFTLILISAVYSASDNRIFLRVSTAIGTIWFVLGWSTYFLGWEGIANLNNVILIVFLSLINIHAIVRLFRIDEADFDVLCAAAVIYLMFAVGWAVSFMIIHQLDPASFNVGGGQVLWSDFLYLSLTTLTTLGYGDITPANAVVRIWVNLEAVTGVLYLALLVARLVAIYQPRRR